MSTHRKLSPQLRRKFLDVTSRVFVGLGYEPQGRNLALLILPLFADSLNDKLAIEDMRQLSKLELAATAIFVARIFIRAESMEGDWDDNESNYVIAERMLEVATEALKEHFGERNNALIMELLQLKIEIRAFDSSICV